MASEVVDTIILSGEDSINFANNLFRPSMDSLHSNSQILASIEKIFILQIQIMGLWLILRIYIWIFWTKLAKKKRNLI